MIDTLKEELNEFLTETYKNTSKQHKRINKLRPESAIESIKKTQTGVKILMRNISSSSRNVRSKPRQQMRRSTCRR